jgi:hypothetical protein
MKAKQPKLKLFKSIKANPRQGRDGGRWKAARQAKQVSRQAWAA